MANTDRTLEVDRERKVKFFCPTVSCLAAVVLTINFPSYLHLQLSGPSSMTTAITRLCLEW